MKIRETLARPFKVIYEALSGSAMGQAYALNDDIENRGFRPISDRFAPAMRRELSSMSHEQMLKMAHFLFTSNPLAKFLINIPTAIVLGRRVEFCLEFDVDRLGWSKEKAKAETERANAFLDPWWSHSSHDFAGRALKYARTYLITGELPLMVTSVNPTTGLFQTDYLDSQMISGVLGFNRLSTVPGTVLIQSENMGAEPVPHVVSHEGAFAGKDSMIFFRHAERLNSLRGFSYLVDVADWIDSHDQSFFGQVDKAILGNTLVHDLTVNGADETMVKKQVEAFRKAAGKPGGIFGHNEQVKHAINTPELNQADDAQFQKALRDHVLGSKGIPIHWYGSGEDSNRSSSESQNDIALKIMESLQDELADIFRTILILGYDQLAEHQGFPARADGANIYPKLPKLSEKDITRMGGVFAQTESALDSAVEGGRLSNATASKVVRSMVEKITGDVIDEDMEQSAIASEKKEREAKAKAQFESDAAQASAKLAGQIKDDRVDESLHRFSSTQADMPPDIAAKVRALAAEVPDSVLGGDGRISDVHVTVKYGTLTSNPAALRLLLMGEPPITLKIGDLSMFDSSSGSDFYEVLKLDVDSPDLVRLNRKISTLPCITSFTYKPHITVAYVTTGSAQALVGLANPLKGTVVEIKQLTFSDQNGLRFTIPLSGKK